MQTLFLLSVVACSISVLCYGIATKDGIVEFGFDSRSGDTKPRKRDITSSGILTGGSSSYICTDAQVTSINDGILDALALADDAHSALLSASVENSQAYTLWFGASNANSQTVTDLQSSYNNVIGQLSATNEDLTSLPNALQSLVFLCAPSTNTNCGSDGFAFSYNSGSGIYKGNLIDLCPDAFEAPSQSSFLSNIASGATVSSVSLGFGILHEAYHISDIVGTTRRCTDQTINGRKAYASADCQALPDNEKVLNAQNLAWFAAHVAAIPSAGVCKSTKTKRQNFNKRQASCSSVPTFPAQASGWGDIDGETENEIPFTVSTVSTVTTVCSGTCATPT